MINIITQFYKVNYANVSDKNLIRARQNEITHCFKQNLNHPCVKSIHFLYEKEEDVDFLKQEGVDINNPKIVFYNLGERMKYSYVFDYCNKHLSGEICVYLHSDMCIFKGFDKLTNIDMSNKIYALTSHNPKSCNRKVICKCTRQFNTDKGWYGVTFDGFAFKSPIKEEVIKESNHIVHMMGSETRLISILKDNGYNVVAPNSLLICDHYHEVKIFANQHSLWITRNGEFKPLEYYSKIHIKQKKKAWKDRIVGGGIPFFNGSCKIVNKL